MLEDPRGPRKGKSFLPDHLEVIFSEGLIFGLRLQESETYNFKNLPNDRKLNELKRICFFRKFVGTVFALLAFKIGSEKTP